MKADRFFCHVADQSSNGINMNLYVSCQFEIKYCMKISTFNFFFLSDSLIDWQIHSLLKWLASAPHWRSRVSPQVESRASWQVIVCHHWDWNTTFWSTPAWPEPQRRRTSSANTFQVAETFRTCSSRPPWGFVFWQTGCLFFSSTLFFWV